MFNPEDLLMTSVEGEMATTYDPVPVGEYNAVIEKVEPKVTPNGKALLECHFKIDAPNDPEAHERTVRYAVWLDVNENGALDRGKGKNVSLGRLRDAVGQNTPGAWNPGMLNGVVARISVDHEPDKTDSNIIYARVKGVAKAA